MIEPVAFGFNHQTAVNNYFQQKEVGAENDIQDRAYAEFTSMVAKLRANGVNVLVVKDTEQPHTPDSIFPNNWISFHEGGQVVLYPMFARNRRWERRNDILQLIEDKGSIVNNVDDFTFWEEQNKFLEGTGSMVLDRVHRVAYAALSERTNKSLFLQFCKVFDLKPIHFSANQTVEKKRLPIYHTNVMMCIASEYAVVCLESIDSEKEYRTVVDSLISLGKEIITISEKQMHNFAGNMLQVENADGSQFLVMSQSAYDSLNQFQIYRLNAYNELIVVDIPTIEKVGGGSVRCMMAEIF
ncbi:MAG: amidinotransferase [Paludibacter sp.]|nr:amidinotransferase [Paludibacter sp.]MBP7612394.1 amidinotransferase [Paludibacter sp.]